MRVHLCRPDITERDIEAVCDVLRCPDLSLGPKVAEFESAFAGYSQGGFPDARFSANEDQRSGNNAPSQHPVELLVHKVDAGHLLRLYLVDGLRCHVGSVLL